MISLVIVLVFDFGFSIKFFGVGVLEPSFHCFKFIYFKYGKNLGAFDVFSSFAIKPIVFYI